MRSQHGVDAGILRADQLQSPLGLVAGSGQYPIQFAQAAQAMGLQVVAVAHHGESDPELERYVSKCTWIRVGELGKLIDILTTSGVKQAAFAGGISRIKLFGGVKLDLRGLQLIARIRSVKDDILLRGIAEELEHSGVKVISASLLLAQTSPPAGLLTRRGLTGEEISDALIGWDVCKAIGQLDVGQTVVVCDGLVTAVEAVEGTDATIRRAGALAGKGGVVIKLSKPQQDLRLDLPTVGTQTIQSMIEAKVTALILEAGRCVVLDQQAVVSAAERAAISILVCRSREDLKGE